MLRTLLGRLTDDDLAESIVGDLEEQRRARAGGFGIRATAWYVTALAALVAVILLHKISKSARWLTPGRGFNPRREVQQALRSLWSARWFSAAVITVIALSMALAATVWAIVDGVLFKAMPYSSAGRLYAITAWNTSRGEPTRRMSFVAPADVRVWTTALPDALLTAFTIGGIETIGENEAARSVQVDARFFDVVGVPPMVGGFHPSHFAARTPIRPAVLTHAFWQSRFGGDRAVLGRTFADSRGQGIAVVGIMPPGFVFPHWSTAVQPAVLTPSIDVPETSDDSEGR
ncbi:MAG TPA: ABC transporter permease, partial [Vicinamibacterales bacterium]